MKKRLFTKSLLFGSLSGLIFLSVFVVGYHGIPNEFYTNRDDALITFSHAKNLADYGSIGVNPSGERVEGYSTPVQFFLFYIVYELSGISYSTFTILQTYIFTFLLGFVFIKFFKSNYLLGLLLSLFSAVLLVRDPSFFEWHGSGMENPITHCLFLLSLYLLYKMFRDKRIQYSYCAIFVIASMSRIESIYYIVPLLLIFALFYLKETKSLKGFGFLSTVVLFWIFINLIRLLYFGDLLPNTAYAHDILLLQRIQSLLFFQGDIYLQSWTLMKAIFVRHLGIILVISFLLIFFLKTSKEWLFLVTIQISFILLTLLNPFFFGESALDPTRTTSQMAVFVVLFICLLLFNFKKQKLLPLVVPIFFTLCFFITSAVGAQSYDLAWSTQYFSQIRTELLELKTQQDIPRPTLANPDLGILSWHKDFNIIDLGKLGSSVLSRLKHNHTVADYLFTFRSPDFIEIHDGWSCHYAYLFSNPRFKALYEPVREQRSDWLEKNCANAPQVKSGIWIRKDIKRDSPSRERRLIDRLTQHLSVDTIKQELTLSSKKEDPLAGLYVLRTAYRFLPEFKKEKKLDELIEVFKDSKTSEYDIALLTGGKKRDWYKTVLSFISQQSQRQIQVEFQETGRIDVSDIKEKSGFYNDGIWTESDAYFQNLSYRVNPEDQYLVLVTYGFRPMHLREISGINIYLAVNGIELLFSHMDGLSYYFELPTSLDQIQQLHIRSSTFIPQEEGINPDTRKLGLDLQAIEIR